MSSPVPTANIQVGDTGTELVIEIVDESGDPVDVSLAFALRMFLRKPDEQTVLTVNAVVDTTGTDGKIRYTTQAGDIDTDGIWAIQGYTQIGSSVWRTEVFEFDVNPNLA